MFFVDIKNDLDLLSCYKSREKVKLICGYCHCNFDTTKKAIQDRIRNNATNMYCTHECASYGIAKAAGYGSTECVCANCKTKFVRNNFANTKTKSGNQFCSSNCSATFNNKGRVVSEQQKKKTSETLKNRLKNPIATVTKSVKGKKVEKVVLWTYDDATRLHKTAASKKICIMETTEKFYVIKGGIIKDSQKDLTNAKRIAEQLI
ncbi:hypothetical protein phiOC_p290 [Ochrobactrum phage vB_OspM_OC]|nr:hypothetical protein phiOC_p290 [Ochrobactrum phage vB_OspM_OC]